MYRAMIGYQRINSLDQRCDFALHRIIGKYSAVSGMPDANYISILSTAVSCARPSPSVMIYDSESFTVVEGKTKQHIHEALFSSHML